MSVPDFIEMIRPYPDEQRWELIDGEPVLMSPQSERHQRIVMNVLRRLDQLAIAQGCVALPGLGLLGDEADNYAPIPDIVVRCGPNLDSGYARDPIVLAEVLSPSTLNNDRGRKSDFYRSIASLRTILIVYQDEIRVEAWQRDRDEWAFQVLKNRSEILAIPELQGSLSLAEVYATVPIAD